MAEAETEDSSEREDATNVPKTSRNGSSSKHKIDVKKLSKACKDVGKLLNQIGDELSKVEFSDVGALSAAPASNAQHSNTKTKTPRPPNKYNIFMQHKIAELKRDRPELTHQDRFKQAASQWKDSNENPKRSGNSPQASEQTHTGKRNDDDHEHATESNRKAQRTEGADHEQSRAMQQPGPAASANGEAAMHGDAGEKKRKKKKKKSKRRESEGDNTAQEHHKQPSSHE